MNLAIDILRSSNALGTMTAMILAVLTRDEVFTVPVGRVQPDFADCLPTLFAAAAAKSI